MNGYNKGMGDLILHALEGERADCSFVQIVQFSSQLLALFPSCTKALVFAPSSPIQLNPGIAQIAIRKSLFPHVALGCLLAALTGISLV